MTNPFKFEPLRVSAAGATQAPPPSADPNSGVVSTSVPASFERSDTTRYLAAAVYLDPFLRDRVLAQVFQEKHRAIVSSFGVDLAIVAGHSLLARRKHMLREAVMFGLLVLSACGFLPGPDLADIVNEPASLLTSPITLLVWLSVVFDAYVTRYHTLGTHFARNNFVLAPDRGFDKLSSKQQAKLKEISSIQRGNVVISGAYNPFVGSGIVVGSWSFAVRTDKGKSDTGKTSAPQQFMIHELHDSLSKSVAALGIEGLSLEDNLYIDGQEIRDDSRFLPVSAGRPLATVDAAIVSKFRENPSDAIRHYKCIQTISWKGEMVLSVLVRFTKTKSSLFAEACYCLLPPLRECHREIDSYSPMLSLGEAAKILVRASFAAVFVPFIWSWSTFRNIARPLTEWWKEQRTLREIRYNPAFNYGALETIRQTETAGNYRRYFQLLDKEMHMKMIERQIFDCVIEFLDGRGIDTSDLRERKQTILNNGVIINGGFVQGSVAAGHQAAATVSRIVNSVASFSPLTASKNKAQSD